MPHPPASTRSPDPLSAALPDLNKCSLFLLHTRNRAPLIVRSPPSYARAFKHNKRTAIKFRWLEREMITSSMRFIIVTCWISDATLRFGLMWDVEPVAGEPSGEVFHKKKRGADALHRRPSIFQTSSMVLERLGGSVKYAPLRCESVFSPPSPLLATPTLARLSVCMSLFLLCFLCWCKRVRERARFKRVLMVKVDS